MKRITTYIYSFLLLIMHSIAFAHGNEKEELGHHWENPIYVKEIWLQIMIIIIICLAYITLTGFIKNRYRTERSNEK